MAVQGMSGAMVARQVSFRLFVARMFAKPTCVRQIDLVSLFGVQGFVSLSGMISYDETIGDRRVAPPGSSHRRLTQPFRSERRVMLVPWRYFRGRALYITLLQGTAFPLRCLPYYSIIEVFCLFSIGHVRAFWSRRIAYSRSAGSRGSTGARERQCLVLRGSHFSVVHRNWRAPGGIFTGDRSDRQGFTAGTVRLAFLLLWIGTVQFLSSEVNMTQSALLRVDSALAT